ncbi:hypothetical protein QWY31_05785 [Cytophagales bacterium LB-30]|uniref:Uncharacterized protein n=1 Tax=Shiella aurantiaca TaxID=3058365 RepID=A0ABT8F3X7_9BACT|nr:hypothetical protein [Shiella aurantiaca]MDN4165003.1 hypothetical protein [Shiella aurantiaca]
MPVSTAFHSFHIPVMGLAYTIDTPIRVAHLGISSVLSIGDDMLIERVRKYYSEKFSLSFSPIFLAEQDARARRITSYLDMVQKVVQMKWEEHKAKLIHNSEGYRAYFMGLLPDYSSVKSELLQLFQQASPAVLSDWMNAHLKPGSIDVNIMTKLDKVNHHKGEELPVAYNDAHAALRGFALSGLSSSVVLSAGMNPRLFAYMENFEDFFPHPQQGLKKKITVKVSDYRSALIQGKFLAKKGLWVSEYRIESGLNCGGHAFATQGQLMGPILEEFKQSRQELINSVFAIYRAALVEKGRYCPETAPELKLSAQGGVGTSAEHEFLLSYYGLQSVGWGSPFLLVPEAVSIDEETLQQLSEATEKDLYLSHASPLGVPFNNLRGSSRQQQMQQMQKQGKMGSPCTKKYLLLNTEFTQEPICTASTKYQKAKIATLKAQNLPEAQYQQAYAQVVEKECLCGGLAVPFLEENGLDTRVEGKGVSICPGPNMAYFSGQFTLQEMVEHIYGKRNIITRTDRPHMFIKELQLYMDYHAEQLRTYAEAPAAKMKSVLEDFQIHLMDSIEYYKKVFVKQKMNAAPILEQLEATEITLKALQLRLLGEELHTV